MPHTYKTSGYKARQYEDIARLLGQTKRVNPCAALEDLHTDFVSMFRADNDRFDVHRFDSRVEEWRTGKQS